MRYLKIYAHNLYPDKWPDVVYLEFYDDIPAPGTLIKKATAFEISLDGKLDWVIADDMNGDGVEDKQDDDLAIELAQIFLKFNWYSLVEPFDKYLKAFVEDYDADGKPDTVRLHFHQGDGEPRDETLAYTAALYKNGDGSGEGTTINHDVNNDTKNDAVDSALVKEFSEYFLKFSWY